MIAFSAILGLALTMQLPQGDRAARDARGARARVPEPTETRAVALRAERAPVIDGKDDDAIWADAPPIASLATRRRAI